MQATSSRFSLENADQRKLDAALSYANRLINLEGGFNLKGWMLLARILSAQIRFEDSEAIINAALDQTLKWDQGDLLRTKAKLQLAQGQIKGAIQTYTELLTVLQIQRKSVGLPKQHLEVGENCHLRLELETWNDLAMVYINLSKWQDAEACLLKSKALTIRLLHDMLMFKWNHRTYRLTNIISILFIDCQRFSL